MKWSHQRNQQEDLDGFRNAYPFLFVDHWDALDRGQRTDEQTKWDSLTLGEKRGLAQAAGVAYGKKVQQQQESQQRSEFGRRGKLSVDSRDGQQSLPTSTSINPVSNRILIAEDHYVSRHLLERNLSNWGFRVTTVEDGEAALRILESMDPPSLALIDWMMPGLDGLEVCRRTRAIMDRPYIYLVLLTAKSHQEEIAMGLDAGADDYVIKPFDADELRARLKVGKRVVELERHMAYRVSELEAVLADVKRLKRLLPICMYCKSIRDDKDYWHEVAEYLHTETGADFTHGICPTCMEKLKAESPLIFS